MIPKKLHLHDDIFNTDALDATPTRHGFGDGLVDAGNDNDRVVALCADLTESTRMHTFREKFPERYVELGVAEQNLATVASGMAAAGKIPFIASYATFSPGRNNEQIRTTIALNQQPVKIVGGHAGLSVGPDGATHQALEDMGLMRMMPNMTVISPCDAHQARKATRASIDIDGPVYIRLSRAPFPVFTTEETPFEVGKAQVMHDPENPITTIIATGVMVYPSLCVAHNLTEQGIPVAVINVHTIKPLDVNTIVDYAKKSGAVVTCEEHQVTGGLGSAVAEALTQHHPVPMEYIGVHDQFGQSGEPHELMEHYGLGNTHIEKAVKRVIERRG